MAKTAPAAQTSASGTALYNRYRPQRLAEVVGQDHVTEPIRNALASGKVHHAYLFSGPHGCGKTSLARIMAHALVCENFPVADPCGQCQTCKDIAADKQHLDIIEIDAASQGGVDDARSLREKAHYSPVQSRFKIFIIDEAHMVSTAGFNALLKLVEEPPAFVKFIFATTEPDKVLGTIRSRTYNYPLRLVAPIILVEHLGEVLTKEASTAEEGVLPLIVRASGGSVRNSLGILGQLLDGSLDSRVTLAATAALLGSTTDGVLDDIIAGLVERSPAATLATVGAALDTGADAKRLAEDLLDRLRDLLVLATTGKVPDLAAIAGPQRTAAWADHAKSLGIRGLTTTAENLQEALSRMPGQAAPARIALEFACTRMLISLVDTTDLPGPGRGDAAHRRRCARGAGDAPGGRAGPPGRPAGR